MGREFRAPAASVQVKYVNFEPRCKAENLQTSSGHDFNTPTISRAPIKQHVTSNFTVNFYIP